jgi:hypothetical protein
MESLLRELDPAAGRRGYWATFHKSVLDAARFELLRRRRLAQVTVAGTVTSWARAVVPSALLTAAAAAVILLVVPAPGPTADSVARVDEMRFIGLDEESIPDLVEDNRVEVILAASELF